MRVSMSNLFSESGAFASESCPVRERQVTVARSPGPGRPVSTLRAASARPGGPGFAGYGENGAMKITGSNFGAYWHRRPNWGEIRRKAIAVTVRTGH